MPENYVLLERIELNASATSVTFANIPQTGYTDLKLVCSTRSDSSTNSGVYDNTQIYVNGNSTGSNYSNLRLYGTGSAASSDSNSSAYYTGASTGNAVTTNTFANSEYYFANYNSTTAYKSMSSDSTTENNATAVFQTLSAWLYKQNTAISSITLNLFSGANFIAGSTFSLYGIAALGTTPVIAPKAIGGNRIDNDGTYWYHTFTSSGAFVPLQGITADIFQVAGGGAGGGSYSAGGGGAGGVQTFTAQALTAINYNVTVGAGGPSFVGGYQLNNTNSGNNSQFGSLTASVGGGAGGVPTTYAAGKNGGSGGGSVDGASAGSPQSGQGNAGGVGASGAGGTGAGAGGGGWGSAGSNSSVNNSGAAGAGNWSSLTDAIGLATSLGQLSGGHYYFAGGGGGGCESASGNPSAGGIGGGGAGTKTTDGGNGTVNTGGGGGGGGRGSNPGFPNGGAGGSGIIVVRYPIA